LTFARLWTSAFRVTIATRSRARDFTTWDHHRNARAGRFIGGEEELFAVGVREGTLPTSAVDVRCVGPEEHANHLSNENVDLHVI
jgi:hypothetical protein